MAILSHFLLSHSGKDRRGETRNASLNTRTDLAGQTVSALTAPGLPMLRHTTPEEISLPAPLTLSSRFCHNPSGHRSQTMPLRYAITESNRGKPGFPSLRAGRKNDGAEPALSLPAHFLIRVRLPQCFAPRQSYYRSETSATSGRCRRLPCLGRNYCWDLFVISSLARAANGRDRLQKGHGTSLQIERMGQNLQPPDQDPRQNPVTNERPRDKSRAILFSNALGSEGCRGC